MTEEDKQKIREAFNIAKGILDADGKIEIHSLDDTKKNGIEFGYEKPTQNKPEGLDEYDDTVWVAKLDNDNKRIDYEANSTEKYDIQLPRRDNYEEKEINYRKLLKRYMARVLDCEGRFLIDDGIAHEVKLTDEEKEVLEGISKEISNKW